MTPYYHSCLFLNCNNESTLSLEIPLRRDCYSLKNLPNPPPNQLYKIKSIFILSLGSDTLGKGIDRVLCSASGGEFVPFSQSFTKLSWHPREHLLAMMNGQGSHPNSSLGNFFVDERPDTNNRGVVQHNVVPANVSVCEQVPANPAVFDGSMLIGWIGQSTSTMNTQNRERVGMVLTNTPVTYHPSILEGAHSGALNGIEQNTASEGNHNDANQGMPAGYVMEETQGREGLSDRRRLTYKRRAPEDAPRQLPLGVSSSSSQQVGNFQLQVAHVQEDAISTPLFNPPNISHPDQFDGRLETGMTRTLSELYRTTTEARQAESFFRNIRMRRALTNPQDIIPPSILSSGTRRYPHLQSPNQSAIFSQFDHLQNLSSATAAPVHAPPPFLSPSYAPDSLQILHPSPWVDVMRSRTTFSSISPAHMQQQWNMRNFPSNISVVPETERRNMVCSPTNLNFAIETADRENMASTSVNVSRSGVHVSAAPTWTQPHLTEQYEERFSNIVTHSMNESAGFGFEGQDSFHTLHSGAHATRRAMESSVRGGNGRLSQVHHRPGLMTRPDRRDDGPENLPSARSWAVTQRRGRLLSEVQNALALLRGSGTLLGIEDVIIDDSVLFSVPEEHDVHEDMRLDVDNMSYEELLALEDDIGNVCTGLSEETILANLRRQKYQSVSTVSSAGNEPCCICQDEYVDEEDMGKLDCGHNFHFNCIRQWLVHKNSCPICKNTALHITDFKESFAKDHRCSP